MDEIEVIEYKSAMVDMIDLATAHANAVRAYYTALMESGFTRNEALKIVAHHGYMPPMQKSGDSA